MMQNTFENIVAKGEIAQNEQFLLIATMILTVFNNYTCTINHQLSASNFLYVGKGLIKPP